MKTKFKLFIVLLATFCIALTCGLVAACKNDPETVEPEDFGDPTEDGYVITVLFPDGSPVTNMDGDTQYDHPTVELTDENGARIAKAEINASGVAYIDYFIPGEYYIKVTDYPSGYFFDDTAVKTSADRAFYTVSIEYATDTSYTVNLAYPNKTPMPDVTVKLMNGAQTVATATTNANGVAATPVIARGAYKIVLENLPEGYGYKAVSTTIAAKPVDIITVVLKDITFEAEDKLDEEGIKPWDDALNSYASEGNSSTINVIRFNKAADCYAYTANVGAGEEVFFTIHAPKTGAYTIGSKKGNDYVIQFYNEDLTYFDNNLSISSASNNGNNVQKMQIEEGETLNFSVKSQSRQAAEVEVLICLPVPTAKSVTVTAVGTYTLTFDGINEAIINFVTDRTEGQGFGQGVYTFTSLTDEYDVLIIEYANNYPMSDDKSDLTGDYEGYRGDDNSGEGLNFFYTKTLELAYVGGTFQYHVIIKGEVVDHPVQIKVKIERTGDAEEKVITRETATTNVSEKYADQEGTFTWMPTDGSLTPYKKDDGKWYVQVNGEEKALVVAITKELHSQVYSFANVEYFGEQSGEDSKPTAEPQNTKLTVYEDLTTQDTTWNYTGFIEEYAKYVNDDGVYEVNDELKLFVERYMNQSYQDFIEANPDGSVTKPAQPWLIGCGYYATQADEGQD